MYAQLSSSGPLILPSKKSKTRDNFLVVSKTFDFFSCPVGFFSEFKKIKRDFEIFLNNYQVRIV